MLAVMEQTPESSRDLVEDFLTTGRTGRRNAMADILNEHANTGSGGLSEHMERLSTDQSGAGDAGAGAGTSGQAKATASTSGAGSGSGSGPAQPPPKEGGR